MKKVNVAQILLNTGMTDDRNIYLPVTLTAATTEPSVGKVLNYSLLSAVRWIYYDKLIEATNLRFLSLKNDSIYFSEICLNNLGRFTPFGINEIEKIDSQKALNNLSKCSMRLKRGTVIKFEISREDISKFNEICAVQRNMYSDIGAPSNINNNLEENSAQEADKAAHKRRIGGS